MTSPLTYDAVISAPSSLPTDLTATRYDAEAHKIVVTFRDDKVARVLTREIALSTKGFRSRSRSSTTLVSMRTFTGRLTGIFGSNSRCILLAVHDR
jgi:hypothetical protein